jgi:hypothetical protein
MSLRRAGLVSEVVEITVSGVIKLALMFSFMLGSFGR